MIVSWFIKKSPLFEILDFFLILVCYKQYLGGYIFMIISLGKYMEREVLSQWVHKMLPEKSY